MTMTFRRGIVAALAALTLALAGLALAAPGARAAPAAHAAIAVATAHAPAVTAHPAAPAILTAAAALAAPAGHLTPAGHTAPLITVPAGPATARGPPALALAGTPSLCTPAHNCGNFWNGGFLLTDYNAIGVRNDALRVVSIGNGHVQLEDLLHGGCVGAWQDNPATARAGGGLNCPSSGTAAWGTIMTADYAVCAPLGPAWFKLIDRYWNGVVGIPATNGSQVYLNDQWGGTAGCLTQF